MQAMPVYRPEPAARCKMKAHRKSTTLQKPCICNQLRSMERELDTKCLDRPADRTSCDNQRCKHTARCEHQPSGSKSRNPHGAHDKLNSQRNNNAAAITEDSLALIRTSCVGEETTCNSIKKCNWRGDWIVAVSRFRPLGYPWSTIKSNTIPHPLTDTNAWRSQC